MVIMNFSSPHVQISSAINAVGFLADFVFLSAISGLLFGLWRAESCAGVSAKTQILFALVWTTRYFDVFLNYVSVYDTLIKISIMMISLATLITIFAKFRNTYDRNQDSFCAESLAIPCLLLALVTNSRFHLVEALWTFSFYLEAVAILPQILMTSKIGQPHPVRFYLFALTLHRTLYIVDWAMRNHFQDFFDPIVCIAGGVQATILWSSVISMRSSALESKAKEPHVEECWNASYAQRMMESLAEIIYGAGDGAVYELRELQTELRRRGTSVRNSDLKKSGYKNFKMFVEDQPWLVLYIKEDCWFVRRRRDREQRPARALVDTNRRLKSKAEKRNIIDQEIDEADFIDPYEA